MRRPEKNFCLNLKSGNAVLLHPGFFPPSLFVRSGDNQELESGPKAALPRRGSRIPGARLHLVTQPGMAGRGSSPEPRRDTCSRRYPTGPGFAGPGRAVPAPCAPPAAWNQERLSRSRSERSAPTGEASPGLGSNSLISEKGNEIQDGQGRRQGLSRGGEPPVTGLAGYTYAHPRSPSRRRIGAAGRAVPWDRGQSLAGAESSEIRMRRTRL